MPMPQGMQIPPSLSAAPSRVGPGMAPSGNQGNAAMAMIDIKNAINMLQKALPMIPMGSPLHMEVLNATKSLIKHMPEDGGANRGLELQSLLQMARSSQQQPNIAALSRMSQGGGQPPAMPAAQGGQPPAAPAA